MVKRGGKHVRTGHAGISHHFFDHSCSIRRAPDLGIAKWLGTSLKELKKSLKDADPTEDVKK